MTDNFGRKIEYMRISVTDRCNLRCMYCMPEGIDLLPMDTILSYEEIALIVRCAVSLGITKFKITGGEPLVRKGVTDLIKMLKGIEGVEQVTLTTNGVLLSQYIDELIGAGIDGINISLDTLDPALYSKITGSDELGEVTEGIEKALKYGIKLKVNAVVLSDVSMDNYIALAALAKDKKLDVRFIEMMPIGAGREFESIDCNKILEAVFERFVPKHELKDKTIGEYIDAVKSDRCHGNGPAKYYIIPGFSGSIGVINSIHDKFCYNCNRIRLTSTGELKPCLYYGDTVNLRNILRENNDNKNIINLSRDADLYRNINNINEKIMTAIEEAILNKPCGHDFAEGEAMEIRKMSQIGG